MAIDRAQQARWGKVGGLRTSARHDAREITAPAREAFGRRFVDEVDPDRTLPEAERTRRATAARKAYFAELTVKSLAARRLRSSSKAATAGARLPTVTNAAASSDEPAAAPGR